MVKIEVYNIMSWEDTYKSLVLDIEATITDPPSAVEYIYNALLTV